MVKQKKLGKRVLSILLSMTLVMSGLMVPAREINAAETSAFTVDAITDNGLSMPTADLFTFTAPTDLVFTGDKLLVPEGMITGAEGTGAITYKFYHEAAPDTALAAPVNAGTYKVAIDVAEGTAYANATGITSEDWTFTVAKADFREEYVISILGDGVDWYYDGTDKSGGIVLRTMDGIVGYGSVTKTFYKDGVETPFVNAGTYTVKFDVAEGMNYNAITNLTSMWWKIEIYKARTTPNMPDATMDVLYSTKTIDAVQLPKDWVWSDEDKAKTLDIDAGVTATAIYDGADKGNYVTESVEITVTRKNCEHEEGENILFTDEGDKEPTCIEGGIGHTECTKCYERITTSVEVSATGHTGGTATCKEQAKCSVCEEAYGELNKNNHVGGAEVKDAKETTCAEDGYTGDTYCKGCGTKTATGTKIAKSSVHTWEAGVVTKEATATEKGEKTYTCSACKTTKKEEIPALGAPEVGTEKTSDDGKATYEITISNVANGTVTYVAPTNKKTTKVAIPATVVIDGITYKVTAVEKNAFEKNKNIKSVTIGKNVKTIGKEAFSGCTKLKTVTFGSNVTTIGDKAFYNCTALTKISLPSKLKTIGKSAFYGCKKATSITIGKSVTTIGSKAFYGCSKVKTLTIKSTKLTTKKIGSKAFSKTAKNMTVKVPKKKQKAYKSMLIKRGANKKAKFKKL